MLSLIVQVVPAAHCLCWLFIASPVSFVFCTVCYPPHSLPLVFGVHWCLLAFIHWHLLALLVVIVICRPGFIVISTSISPYEQWLAGGVAVL
jgi:hypothetical protein